MVADDAGTDRGGAPLSAGVPTEAPTEAEAARQLAELYEVGASIDGLVTLTGLSYRAVRRLLTEVAGVTLRPRGRSKGDA
jgi:hypothetical protein